MPFYIVAVNDIMYWCMILYNPEFLIIQQNFCVHLMVGLPRLHCMNIIKQQEVLQEGVKNRVHVSAADNFKL